MGFYVLGSREAMPVLNKHLCFYVTCNDVLDTTFSRKGIYTNIPPRFAAPRLLHFFSSLEVLAEENQRGETNLFDLPLLKSVCKGEVTSLNLPLLQ